MTSASFKISSDGGSTYAAVDAPLTYSAALAYNAAGSYSIKAKLDSGAGVNTCTWTIVAADADNMASLPTVTPNEADFSCTFSVPKTGGAWLLQAKVTDGVSPSITKTLKISVKVSTGNELIAVGEQYEASATIGWNKVFNDAQKAGGLGTLIGDVSGPAGSNTVDKIKNLAVSVAGIAAGMALLYTGSGFAASTNFQANVVQAAGYSAPSGSAFQFSSAAPSYSSDANKTLAAAEYNCHDLMVVSGVSLTATRDLILPLTAGGTWRIYNGTTGSQSIRAIGASGTGVTIANGQWGTVRANGTNIVSVAASGGGGGSTPTGTGFVHVTAGVQDGAAALVTNADVDASAAIDPTKLALGAANRVMWSDGATNQWTPFPIATRFDVTGSYRVNGITALSFSTTTLKLGNQTTWTSLLTDVGASCTLDYAWGGTTYLTLSQSAGALTLTPAAAAGALTVQHADKTSASATGAAVSISAQWATGATSTGGAITIAAGYATGQGGAATLRGGDASAGNGGDAIVAAGAGTGGTNGVLQLRWGNSTGINYTKSSTTITALAGATYTSITHGYTDLGTNSATGGVMAVRAQTCTGTTSIGGDMRIGPGGGTSRPGQFLLAFGSVDLVTFTFNSLGYQWTIDSSATSVLWNQTGASGAGTGALWSIAAQSRTSGTGGELRLGGGTGSGSSTHGPVTFTIGGTEVGRWDTGGVLNAKAYTGLSGNAFAYSNLIKTQTGGTTTLSSSEYQYHDITIGGTMTSAGIIEFPATTGGSWTITNSCSGAYALAVRCTGGSRLTYIGRNQSVTVRCDGTDLWAINDKPAVGVLSEGIIDYNGASGGNTDTTIFTISALVSCLITGVELYLDTAQTGTSSVCTLTVGNTAGGMEWIVSQTINTSTAAGTAYGLLLADLGTNFDAAQGYVFYSNRTSGSIIVRCARSVANVTAGKLRYRVLGVVTG